MLDTGLRKGRGGSGGPVPGHPRQAGVVGAVLYDDQVERGNMRKMAAKGSEAEGSHDGCCAPVIQIRTGVAADDPQEDL